MNCFFSHLPLYLKHAFILHDGNCLNVEGFAYLRDLEQLAAVNFDTNLKLEVAGRKDSGHLQRLGGRPLVDDNYVGRLEAFSGLARDLADTWLKF